MGYFINNEAEPRLTLETNSVLSYENLNGTLDINDIFGKTDGVEMAELGVEYKVIGIPGIIMYLACHQVHYCVKR